MIRLSAKARMAVGLAMLVATMLLIIMVCGLVPDHRETAMRGRCALSELVALHIRPVIVEKDLQRIDGLLEAIVTRNEEILSGAVRTESGDLVARVGDHLAHWNNEIEGLDDRQVFVPLNAGGQQWGRVEICFSPLVRRGLIGLLDHPWVRLIGSMTILCCAAFYFYLRAMLSHLDPSRAVPKRVRNALDTLGDGLMILNRECKIVLVNQSLAASIGRSPDSMVGMDVSRLSWRLTHSQQRTGDQQQPIFPWARALEEGRTIQGETIRYSGGPCTNSVFLASCSPVRGGDGSPQGVLVSLDDVTELEETKEQLSEAKDDAEAANQAKSAFLANMSHEIRTPMNAILGFTEVLRRDIENDEAKRRKHLNTIHSSGTHLLSLINDILDLSKVEAGHLEVESIPTAVHQVVAEVVTVLGVRAEEKKITLEYEFKGDIPETIHSDPARLRQILTNLVGNAIKFTQQGGVRIVTQLIDDAHRPQMMIQIIDTGIGMSEAATKKIFDPFSQANASVTRRFGGTGLGLSISKRFTEALGGELTVTSREGVGSVFAVTINTGDLTGIARIDPNDIDAESIVAEVAPGIVQLPQLKVLLVDDAEENRDLLSVVLSRSGATYETAVNGLEAFELATSQSFDVILMDMNMPVMDGYTATRKLRESGYEQPIIALTAHAMEQAGKECAEAGCSGFLTKPVNFDHLLSILAEVAGIDSTPSQASQTDSEALTPHSDSIVMDSDELIYSTLNTDDPKFQAIVNKFVQRLPQQILAMEEALQNEQFEELADLAHWLKGSGPNVGFAGLSKPGKDLEVFAKNENASDALRLLETIRSLSDRIVKATATTETDGATPESTHCSWSSNNQDAPDETPSGLESTLPAHGERFRDVLVQFTQQLDLHIKIAAQAVTDGDIDQLGQSAHWIKDVGASCGFSSIAAIGSRLLALRGKTDLHAAATLIDQLCDLRDRIQLPEQQQLVED